jgi:hypothetical protein
VMSAGMNPKFSIMMPKITAAIGRMTRARIDQLP